MTLMHSFKNRGDLCLSLSTLSHSLSLCCAFHLLSNSTMDSQNTYFPFSRDTSRVSGNEETQFASSDAALDEEDARTISPSSNPAMTGAQASKQAQERRSSSDPIQLVQGTCVVVVQGRQTLQLLSKLSLFVPSRYGRGGAPGRGRGEFLPPAQICIP